MRTAMRSEIYRISLVGAACRSTESLVVLSIREIEGVRSAIISDERELIVLATTNRDLHPEIVRAVVTAGLMPQAVSVGPVFRILHRRPLTQQEAEDLGIEADLERGGATVDLPALEPGTYPFSCGMRMVHGQVIAE